VRKPKVNWLSGRRAVLLLAAVALLGLLGYSVGSGQWQIRPILSGSMRPGFPVGGVAITQREPLADLRVNEVIVTHPPNQPHFDLIHRIIQIKSVTANGAVVQTKGDDNPVADPFTVQVKGPWIYQVRTTVPVLGYAAVAVHSPRGRRILLAGLLVLTVLARTLLGRRRTAADSSSSDSSSSDSSSSGSPRDESASVDTPTAGATSVDTPTAGATSGSGSLTDAESSAHRSLVVLPAEPARRLDRPTPHRRRPVKPDSSRPHARGQAGRST
jgi:signal peptidase